MNTENALVCTELIKAFDTTRALDGLNMKVPRGTIFGLLGPNGSGKTTTIRIALGIYRPDQGRVEVLGAADPLSVREKIGYLPEERGLYPKMKVREQLAFLGSIRGLSMAEADRRAGTWLERLGLGDRGNSLTNEFSKGMQQKVQFASAVMHDPELIVLDEPFTGLDPLNSRLLRDLILEQNRRGVTVILSTHRMEQVEALCESICLIHQGRPVLSGRLSEIKSSYGRSTIAIEYSGPHSALEGLPGVRQVHDSGQGARLQMQRDASSQDILRKLLDRVEVRSFLLEEPRLEEIYLEKVGGAASAIPALEAVV